MITANTYLTFNGNCEAAFNFYKSVFGGDFDFIGRYKEMPNDPNCEVNPEDAEKIMHVSLRIGGSTIMGSDTGGEWAANYKAGNNFSISLNAESKEEADRLFKALSEEGSITMPMNTTFWGSYFGMFTDKFGIQWMMSFDTKPKL
ncbi:MAG: VOC family protein [Bacteroidetes bacterium MedPE-SWsnd-G2]|nr:MAG: VOC family protein [Bacteroidetes bacterium MedPE-SWsnd-G2]